MKKGWRTESLGELCDVLDYKRKPITKCDRVAGDYPYYGATGVLGHVEGYIFDEPLVLVGEDGAKWESGANTAFAVEGKIWVNNHAHVLRPHSDKILDNWLIYFLNHSDLTVFVSGLTVPKLNQGNLREIPIPLAPLAEQQRIVGLLDEAFEGIATAKANAEKNLQNARALFESHLQSVFSQRGKGWVEKSLGNLCDFLNGFAFKSGDVVAESQTQLVRMGNLYGNQLNLDRSPVFYPDSFAIEYSRYVLAQGDIIMSLTGTTGKEDYGFAVRIPDCGHTLLMNQRIMKFDAIRRDIVDDGYLLHYLRSRCFLDILYPTANGTRQANLSSVTMKLLPVPLCSLNEQKVIATKLDALHQETQRLATLYTRKLAALEALKKSLLHQAFSGEL
jgi:type I restriction enzyme S subunit